MRLGAIALAVLVVGPVLLTRQAGAQAAVPPTPAFPEMVTVGETFGAHITIAPGMTQPPPAAPSPVFTVGQIELVPSCHTTAVACLNGVDAGVFSISPTASAPTGPPTCVGPWAVTETVPGTFAFLPPGGEGSLDLVGAETCVVGFMVTVRRGASIDVDPVLPETQTDQLVTATVSVPGAGAFRSSGWDRTTVLRAPTRMTTRATSVAVVGQPIVDVATVAGGVEPTGTVTFFTFGPDDPTCTGFPRALGILNPLVPGSPPSATSALSSPPHRARTPG